MSVARGRGTDDGVRHLRDLHSGDVGDVEREQQQIAGYGNQQARAEGAPERPPTPR
jgi:hypothetical protein